MKFTLNDEKVERTTVCVSAAFSRNDAVACRAGEPAVPLGRGTQRLPILQPSPAWPGSPTPPQPVPLDDEAGVFLTGFVAPQGHAPRRAYRGGFKPPTPTFGEWTPFHGPPTPGGFDTEWRRYPLAPERLASLFGRVGGELGLTPKAPAGYGPQPAVWVWQSPLRPGEPAAFEVAVGPWADEAAVSVRAPAYERGQPLCSPPRDLPWALRSLAALAAGAALALAGELFLLALRALAWPDFGNRGFVYALGFAFAYTSFHALSAYTKYRATTRQKAAIELFRQQVSAQAFAAVERELRRSPYR